MYVRTYVRTDGHLKPALLGRTLSNSRPKSKSEQAYRISTPQVIIVRAVTFEEVQKLLSGHTHTNTHQTSCFTWTTQMVSNKVLVL